MGGMPYEERLAGELVLNSSDRVMHLTRAELDGILADWHRFQPNVLRCDPVYAVALVRALERAQLPIPRVASVWCGFEYCSVLHRRILEDAFGAIVVDYYGGTDIGGSEAAFRCENGRYHVWEDAYALEFVQGSEPVAAGEVGEILVTSLRNRVMPLLRYRIGDLGRPLAYDCGCAHDYWQAFHVEGRVKDVIAARSGAPVTTRSIDELFRDLGWIDYYQFVERGPADYALLAVRRDGAAGAAASPNDEATFLHRAEELLGARVSIRYVREIAPEKSLKYRLTRRDAGSAWALRVDHA
jgi:phenylacetate-CoA ligase